MDLISELFLVVMVDTDGVQRTTNDGRRTTPRVWHKLPTGELKKPVIIFIIANKIFFSYRINPEAKKISKHIIFWLEIGGGRKQAGSKH